MGKTIEHKPLTAAQAAPFCYGTNTMFTASFACDDNPSPLDVAATMLSFDLRRPNMHKPIAKVIVTVTSIEVRDTRDNLVCTFLYSGWLRMTNKSRHVNTVRIVREICGLTLTEECLRVAPDEDEDHLIVIEKCTSTGIWRLID